MNAKWMTSVVAVATGVLFAGAANAQPKDQPSEGQGDASLAPATRSVELTIGTGYEQGFGKIVDGQPSLTDVGQAGGAIEASVGYRLIPELTLGVYGSGGEFSRGDSVDGSTNLYTATAGLKADWHFLPAGQEWDPWVSLGTGWRGYWLNDTQGTTSTHGWEIAKLEVGLDYRLDRAIALGPVVGGDVTTFFTQSTPGTSYASISSPQASTFIFAGVQGRFDIATGSDSTRVASR
jgi:hypothetical protein